VPDEPDPPVDGGAEGVSLVVADEGGGVVVTVTVGD